jgi:parallel beta-helix repeat protein
MHKRYIGIIIVLGFIVLLFADIFPTQLNHVREFRNEQITSSPAWGGMVVTAPFQVIGDADFPVHGATGSGTVGDPWVFENLLVECDYASFGIAITDTVDYFVIRDCFINESWDNPAGAISIALQNADNGIIENNTIEFAMEHGIAIVLSQNAIVANNTIRDTDQIGAIGNAIWIVDSTGISVEDNVLLNNTHSYGILGISAFGTTVSNVNVTGNVLNDTYTAITFSAGSNDILVDANYVYNVSMRQVSMFDSYNFTISNNILDSHTGGGIGFGIEIDTCQNFTIDGNDMTKTLGGGDEDLFIIDCARFNVTNNNILCTSGFIGSIALSDNCTDAIIANNMLDPRPFDSYAGIVLGSGAMDVTIDGNTIYNASTHGGIGLNGANITITNNTIVGDYDASTGTTNAGIYAGHFETVVNATIANNTFIGYNVIPSIRFTVRDINASITGNYFENVTNYFINASTGDVQTWHSNYYADYFDVFPFAVTVNSTTDILEFEYVVTPSLNDTRPVYAGIYYPRSTMVYLNFFSNVDGLGIPFANLHVLLDSVPLTITYPLINSVLFRLTVSDYKSRLLYDEMLNLNSTGIYIDIGLDVAVQIFISYYSSFDLFGLPFDLVKLYIDSVRITRFDPIMELRITNILIRDFANRILYNQTVNFSVSGIYLDIGLDIALVTIHNEFDFDVLFHYSISGVSVVFPMASDQIMSLRMAVGSYQYWVTDLDGDLLEDDDGHNILHTKIITGPSAITFGWVEVPVAPVIPPPTDYTSILYSYLSMFALFGVLAGVFIVVAYWLKNVKTKKGKGKGKGRKGKGKGGEPLRIFWS